MFRAVVVGFVLGFAMVGGVRLAQGSGDGPRLALGQALHKGVALDHVGSKPCLPGGTADRRQILLLI